MVPQADARDERWYFVIRRSIPSYETLDGIIADSFTEDYWTITLPNDLAVAAARAPALIA